MSTAAIPGFYDEELCTGGFLDVIHPDASQISLSNIAEPLGRLCRYNGQCDRFYSVAEHACLAAEYARRQDWPNDVVAAVLHHDDAEAFTGDITRPLKKQLRGFAEIESEMMTAVIEALGMEGLPFADYRVKEADEWALMSEAYTMMPSQGAGWFPTTRIVPEPTYWELGWSPGKAASMYRFYDMAIGGRNDPRR